MPRKGFKTFMRTCQIKIKFLAKKFRLNKTQTLVDSPDLGLSKSVVMQTKRKRHKNPKEKIRTEELVDIRDKSNSEKEIRIITQIIDIAGKDKKFHEDFQRDSRDVMFGMTQYGRWKDEPPDLKCKAERQFQDDTTSLADTSDLSDQVLMEEMKGQIKMDGVHLLELGRGELLSLIHI